MTSAAYFREWRAAHPEYRERQRDLRRERRRVNGRGDRTAEFRARARRRVGPPDVPIDHPLLREAVALVGVNASPGGALKFPTELIREDAIGEAVLALLEQRDPAEAVKTFVSRERGWLRVTAELIHAA